MCQRPQITPSRMLASSAANRPCNRGSASPRQPSSSSSGPPRKSTRTNSTSSTPPTPNVSVGDGDPRNATATAIATATIASGNATASAAHRAESLEIEKPARSSRSSARPRIDARAVAAILGPAVAMMFRRRPTGLPMPNEVSAIGIQIAHEIAYVSTKNRPSWYRLRTHFGSDEQDLRPVGVSLDIDRRLTDDLRRATLVEIGLGERTVNDEEIASEASTEIVPHLRQRIEERGVYRSVLMDRHRVGRARSAVLRVSLCRHEDRLQRVTARVGAEFTLLDARVEAAPRGHDPHLDEAHRFGLGAVALRVLHSRAESRSLHRARRKNAAVAARVGMLERPFGDVGDSFDVAVRMHRPCSTGHKAVVVEDAQVAETHVRFVPVLIEAEVPVCREPPALSVVQRRTRAKGDGHAAVLETVTATRRASSCAEALASWTSGSLWAGSLARRPCPRRSR